MSNPVLTMNTYRMQCKAHISVTEAISPQSELGSQSESGNFCGFLVPTYLFAYFGLDHSAECVPVSANQWEVNSKSYKL